MISKDARLLRENVEQVLDRLDQLLVFAVIFSRFETGELIETKIENLIRLMFAESVTAVDQAGFVPDENADFLDLLAGEFEGEQFHPCFVAIG